MLDRARTWMRRLKARRLVIVAMTLIAVFFVYFWHLATLTPGMSPAETIARSSSKSLHGILLNPINAPQRLLQYLAQKSGHHHAFSMRLSSVIIAILLVGCTFWLMKAWFGLAVGVLSTLIFATTPLIVLSARSATPTIMLLTPAAMLAAYVWLSRRAHKPNKPWLALMLVSALSLYAPGMVWLIAATLVLLHRRVFALARSVNRGVLGLSLAAFVLLLVPLIWALVNNISIYHGLLLVPTAWSGITDTAKSIGWSAMGLVWRTQGQNPLIIGRLPLLDIIQVALAVFGTYVMWTRARREMITLLAVIAASIIFAGINHNLLLLSLALPALAILTAAGLRYLYIEWRSVFPRNPLPISFALLVITALVGLQVVYGLQYSLVAWPHTSSTKQLYVLK